MSIEGFNYKEFAADLAQQAKAVLPRDLSDEDKNYIVNIVNNFCFLAGEALSKDKTVTFDVGQASVVTQFIGEWSFHKSVDLIRGGVPPQFRDPILQKIAFTVFEIAKQSLSKNLPQGQMIDLVEHHVKKCFDEALADLKKKGALNDQQMKNAMSQSNIDAMAQADNAAIESASDAKILKMAAFAMILKQLPKDKVGTILNKFAPSEAQVLIQYMQMDDLETKIDTSVVLKCLQEIKTSLPQPKKVNINKTLGQFSRALAKVDVKVLENIVEQERPLVKEFILDEAFDERRNLSPWVIQLICKHVEDKIDDYQKKA
ncbi:MAG: hypothetical protein PHV37_05980 [Candidatus Gastranaerophilales bacterium]|nr:hypothetical protein [Candidatus Gastranaerophilales bacterium]